MKHGKSTVIALLLACACNTPEATGPTVGTFTATISGDIDATLSGAATFDPTDAPWRLTLLAGEPTEFDFDVVTVSRGNPTTPATGSYTLIDAQTMTPDGDDLEAPYYFCRPGQETTTFASVTGTLDVGSSAASEFSGELEFTAVVVLGGGTAANVSVTAQFTAVREAQPDIPMRCW